MTGPSRITAAIRTANDADRVAMVGFLTGGYPNLDAFPSLLDHLRAEADMVEIGVPFSDPMADGVTIQRASHRAIEAGTTLSWILETLTPRPLDPPVVLMSYLNPLLAYGPDRLATDAITAGVAGFIVPDLPLEEAGVLAPVRDQPELALIQLVSPATPPGRLQRIADTTEGFLYAVTVTGTTGGTAAAEPPGEYLDRVRAAAHTPVCAGFGIRHAGHVRALAAHADGVIIGSALIESLDRGEDPAAFIAELRSGSSLRTNVS